MAGVADRKCGANSDIGICVSVLNRFSVIASLAFPPIDAALRFDAHRRLDPAEILRRAEIPRQRSRRAQSRRKNSGDYREASVIGDRRSRARCLRDHLARRGSQQLSFHELSGDRTVGGVRRKARERHVWEIDTPKGEKIRYTIRVVDDEWRETGQYSADGAQWREIFGMTLKRVRSDAAHCD